MTQAMEIAKWAVWILLAAATMKAVLKAEMITMLPITGATTMMISGGSKEARKDDGDKREMPKETAEKGTAKTDGRKTDSAAAPVTKVAQAKEGSEVKEK